MKRIIDGLLFDTDNAQFIASGYMSKRAVQSLYKTRKGNFILTSIDQRDDPEFEDTMVKILPQDAINWLESYRSNQDFTRVEPTVNVDEIYKNHFKEHIQEA